jgi:RNA polymerase sigma factor (sigma-70 family)
MNFQVQDMRGDEPARPDWASRLLGEWQAHEVALAGSYRECRGLTVEDIEDVYQQTVVALLDRDYEEVEHLRSALRIGIKRRALKYHRDQGRRRAILTTRRPGLQRLARLRADEELPEELALSSEERFVISEFLLELDRGEREVFVLAAEGLRYRMIARTLGIAINDARRASRACEQKRERFQLLYDTGRLCGYRAVTIHALQEGEMTSGELAQRAIAHIAHCTTCRMEHKTNAKRLKQSFQREAAALLPLPALVGHHWWLPRLYAQAKVLGHRVMTNTPLVTSGSGVGGGVRERAAMLLASGGIAAKLSAAAATVAVLAGGTVIATHATGRQHDRHESVAPSQRPLAAGLARSPSALLTPSPRTSAQRARPPRGSHHHVAQREPGGFAYQGVPIAKIVPGPVQAPSGPASTTGHQSGGLFSP